MNQETVNECCKIFEEKTDRKITEVEKECILITCIKGGDLRKQKVCRCKEGKV